MKNLVDIKKEPGLTDNLFTCTWMLENGQKCGKTYAVKHSVNRHIKEVHQKVRYSCKQCERQFVSKYTLIRYE